MYNAHKITDKVAAGKMALGSHVGFDSPFITEMIAGCGFDFIWIDGEHSAIDRKDIQSHLLACRAAGAAGIVRVPWNDPVIIKAILDMGADGIVVPMVCSLEEARQAAAATHYPPYGIRGMRGDRWQSMWTLTPCWRRPMWWQSICRCCRSVRG